MTRRTHLAQLAALAAALVALPWPAQAHGPTRQKVEESIDIDAPAADVWARIKKFTALQDWQPLVVRSDADHGDAPGSLRTVQFKAGGQMEESLEGLDEAGMRVKFRSKLGGGLPVLPVNNYTSSLQVSAEGGHCKVEWRGAFYRGYPNNDPPPEQNDEAAVKAVTAYYQAGLAHLKALSEGH